MKFAYADPPYLGTAKRTYGKIHEEAHEYDDPEAHRRLINRLCDEYPDGWVISLHTGSLKPILSMCPDDVRVLAWVKTYCNYSKQRNGIAYAWEPVILRGGRPRDKALTTMKDWFPCPVNLNAGFAGCKPDAFCKWVFEILGMQPGDEFHDLFPGSGAVTRAWQEWKQNRSLFEGEI